MSSKRGRLMLHLKQNRVSVYDELTCYYTDLHALPEITEEEKQQLLASSPLDHEARNRIIEGHLAIATRLARKHCPPGQWQLLPDIIGEMNFILVKATDRANG